MSFQLETLIPEVLEQLRQHLKTGDADGGLVGLDDRRFLVRQGIPGFEPDTTAPPAVVFPDDTDPGVPIVRVTIESIDLPETFDLGDEILIEWRVMLDVLAATATGARTADVDAGTAEARLASWVFALLASRTAYAALEDRGICEALPKIRGLISSDRVFRYPVMLWFRTTATV